jgi:hypothetical protein
VANNYGVKPGLTGRPSGLWWLVKSPYMGEYGAKPWFSVWLSGFGVFFW